MNRQPEFPLFCPVCRRQYEGERSICAADGARLQEIPFVLPRPGNVFDSRYIILETIGKGGMAIIYRGFDAPNRRQCALKVLKTRFSVEERAVSQFFTEARLARRLNHSNIVTTYDYGRTDVGYLYISMELLTGQTLSRTIRQEGPFSTDRAIHIFSQIIDALGAAHAMGTIHRDLKPENVFLIKDGDQEQVRLLDFGIAQFKGLGRTDSREICGTPAYMSPEQIRGHKALPASDIYSAGVVLFEMLTGKQPFTGASALEVLKRQLKMAPPKMNAVAEHLNVDDLVAICLRKKAVERFAAAGEIQNNLFTSGLARLSRSRVLKPLPQPDLDLEPPQPLAVYSYSTQEEKLSSDSQVPELLTGTPEAVTDYLSKGVKPGILLEEKLSILLAEDEGWAPAAESEPANVETQVPEVGLPTGVPSCMADRYTLLHARFIALDEPRQDSTLAEDIRMSLGEDMEPWFDYVQRLGGLVCYDNGAELKVLFGYLTENENHIVAALEAARSLSLHIEYQAIRRGKRLGVRSGVATGVVYTDQNVEGPLDWLIHGSEVDLAVRLSRLSPVGGVLLCQNTALRAMPAAELHEMARLVRRGGLSVGTFLLRNLSTSLATEETGLTAALPALAVKPADINQIDTTH